MSQRVTCPEGERKQVTVVFLDLVGFSEVASVADAEDLQSWLEDYYRLSHQIVEANGGEVTEYLGDGVVAVFGLSRADELAAPKAVNAALQAVTQIAEEASGPRGFTLRAGVATGEVAVRPDITRDAWPRITGMVTTLAQRIQEKATPGDVLISEGTQRLLRGRFRVTPVPDQALKGFAGAQLLFRAQIVPLDALSPPAADLIGRSRQIAVIGAAQKPVLIVGEAGIGKTALAMRMARNAPDCSVFSAEGINGGSSYQPFKNWISRRLEALTPTLGDIRTGFSSLPDADHLSLALIMGLLEGQVLLTELSNVALKARIEASLWRAIGSTQTGGLLVFEDLHWFDIASFGVVQHILRHPESAAFKLILTSREDPKLNQYLDPDEIQTLALDPLGNDDAQRMLAALSCGQIAPEDTARLVGRAGGVPLFLEQLYKRARPQGRAEDAIPETLMDLLAARIDDTGSAKAVLQRASVIGQVFSLEMLTALEPDRRDPTPALEQGVAVGVLVRRSASDWAFAHVLLAQAAYSTILRKRREFLHAQLVEVLRARFPERLARDPALLADHQRKAGQPAPAIRSYLAASQSALLQGAFADAEAHARAALALCPDVPEGDDPGELAIACHTALGSILMQVQGFTAEPVHAAFDAVHQIARSRRALGHASAAALFGSFSHAILAGDKPKADGFSGLLDDLSETLPPHKGRVEVELAALAARNCQCFYQGDFQTQFDQIAKIRRLYRIQDHAAMIARYGMDIFAAAQMFEAPARAISGEVDKVSGLLAETDAHQAALYIPVMLPYALIWGAVPLFYSGRHRGALDRLREGLALAEKQGASFWQTTGQTWNFIMDPSLTRTEAGLDGFRANVALQRSIGANVGVPYFTACYAERQAANGNFAEAYNLSSLAVQEARESGLHCWYPEILRIHAGISRAHNHPGEAEAAMKLSIDTSARQGAALWTLRAMLDMAAHGEGPPEAALTKVIAAFPAGADVPELRRAQDLVAV
ncbi:MAG TPA: adenylate/guanylate cyclase domain-containing protein [Roseovarius sp.]